MVEKDGARDKDIVAIKNAIASIKQSINDNKSPSPSDLKTIEELAAKYPNDQLIQNLLQKATEVMREAIEKASQDIAIQKYEVNAYTYEQREALIEKENEYFKKAIDRHNLVNKMMRGARIDDNDITGYSLTVKQASDFFEEISSNAKERQAASELLSFDLGEYAKKTFLGQQLTEEEEKRRKISSERIENLVLSHL